jgi:hypothetical protein
LIADDFKVGTFDVLENFFLLSAEETGEVAFLIGF